MTIDFSFIDDPDWFIEAKVPQAKNAMLNRAFDIQVGNAPEFVEETPETQALMRQNYLNHAEEYELNSASNPINIENVKENRLGDEGFFKNLFDISVDSIQEAGSGLQLSDDLLTGEFDNNAGRIFSEDIAKQRGKYAPPELKQAHSEVATITKEWDSSETLWGKTKAVAGAVGDFATNVEGFTYMAGESINSLALSAAGATAGTLVAGPAGGLAGMFLAGLPVEAKAAFQQEITQELSKRKLTPTEKNINNLIAETAWRQEALRKAQTKALVTSAVDTAIGFGIGKVAGKLRPKLSNKAKLYTAETLSEGVSEAAGQKAAYGKVDTQEIVAEIMGGVATSPISTAIDKAAFGAKIAKDVGSGTINHIKTGRTDEVKAAKKIADVRAEAKYEKNLESIDNVDELSDPKNDNYSPIKAVDVLALDNSPENIEQAHKIRNDFEEQIKSKAEEIQPLIDKQEKGEKLTKKEKGLVKVRTRTVKELSIALGNIDSKIQEMQIISTENDISPTELKVVAESGDSKTLQNSLVRSFGSSKAGRDIAETLDIKKILERTDLEPQTRTILENVLAFEDKREIYSNLVQNGKSTQEVRQDILTGSPGNKGIATYQRAIAKAVTAGNMIEAQKEYDGLVRFAVNRQKSLTEHIAKKGHDTLTDIKQAEVDLLNAAVLESQSLMGSSESVKDKPVSEPDKPKSEEQDKEVVTEESEVKEPDAQEAPVEALDATLEEKTIDSTTEPEPSKLEGLQVDLSNVKKEIELYQEIRNCIG